LIYASFDAKISSMKKAGEKTTLGLVSDIFSRLGIKGLLIGGFAVNFYKVSRQTADVDFIVDEDDIKKISAFLEEKGFAKTREEKAFICFRANKTYLMDADFMIADRQTIDGLVKSGKQVSIGGEKFLVPSLNHLIALKLHSVKHNPKWRETRDLPDIIELVRMNGIDPKSNEFKRLCLKYGTEELYRKIVKSFKS
jgi:predicted nucleotidyltransferase